MELDMARLHRRNKILEARNRELERRKPSNLPRSRYYDVDEGSDVPYGELPTGKELDRVHMMGSAMRGETYDVWTVVTGLRVPLALADHFIACSPPHLHKYAKDNQLPIGPAFKSLLQETRTHLTTTIAGTPADVKAANLCLQHLQQGYIEACEKVVAQPPTKKDGWKAACFYGAQILGAIATIRFGASEGNEKTLAAYDHLWTKGEFNVSQMWPASKDFPFRDSRRGPAKDYAQGHRQTATQPQRSRGTGASWQGGWRGGGARGGTRGRGGPFRGRGRGF
jgi:hypothetical protein